MGLVMETWFSVEAKSFESSVVEGALGGGKKEGLLRCCILGIMCTTVEELLWCSDLNDFIKSFWEGSKVFIV